ncbi:MAG TPA: TM0106 family RecB-like putative nuclease [Terriglobia bacterium]|nr:TM0106 family RecB-like putative nuclease [Terriglobia bacterium]
MRIDNRQVRMSASDLARHLACRHLTSLDLRAARGEIERPHRNDPSVDVLIERGLRHEAAYLAHLKNQGLEVLANEDGLDDDARVPQTLDAMRTGVAVIAQAGLKDDRWYGRADVLLKVDKPSRLGNWSYEVVDTKLARDTRGGTILQLCMYSELLEKVQGVLPERMHVVTPGRDFQPESFRPQDFLAYYRFVKARLEEVVAAGKDFPTYPEPVEHCDVCQWWPICNDRRRNDDHLAFVAGISKLQRTELRNWQITTLAGLAALPLPITRRPERGARDTYIRVREQARLQLESRNTGNPVHELLLLEPERGLARLPEPSAGDIFLDFEADPFVEEGGLEYLLGYVTLDDKQEPQYTATWALDRHHERRMFESFIDMVLERREQFPDLHIYHYSSYEPGALKRLMGRYASREDEIDRLLRAGVFVDVYRVVKQALRAGIETYSLKALEVFYLFTRETALQDAKHNLTHLECALELNETANLPAAVFKTVESYNREDCISTLKLRDWLEEIRHGLVRDGMPIQRPALEPGDPSENVDERRKRALALMERLLRNVPEERSERTPEQHATWLLAYMLEWHRREDKVSWWEYYRLCELTDDELVDEPSAIAGLEFVRRIGGTAKCPIDRYRFPAQDTQVRQGDSLKTSAGDFGSADAIDMVERTLDIKKRTDTAELHPKSVFVHNVIGTTEQAESLYRLGAWVAANGVDAPGPYRAGRDLLLRNPPRLKTGVLPIQGPPGAGKTYKAARMICDLLREKKKVGITAVSHKVIRKLLEEVLKAAKEEKVAVHCIEKVKEKSKNPNRSIPETTENKRVLAAIKTGEAQVAAGTAWLWARNDFAESVDVLFVDEAGQMSLADVLAVSQGAKSLVLLGDPQQLEQPLQGTHPPGVDASALQHVLGPHETMPADMGQFLGETWRLAPSICRFTSELFYENRLEPRAGLERQALNGPTRFPGSGLWFVPVVHEGNQNSSAEEARAVAEIVRDLLQPGTSWTNMKGETNPLTPDDILIVAPYNAQVFKIAEHVSGVKIGTVDKFQGQEAPVVIYSMTTSSPEDAPRGMEFLYSLNRFNVASSRARCACILVASPLLFEPECQTPRQMKLANVLCRYLEMAKVTA